MTTKVCLLVKSLSNNGVGSTYATFANLLTEIGCEVHLIVREGEIAFPINEKVCLHHLHKKHFRDQLREIAKLVSQLEQSGKFTLTLTPAERFMDVLPQSTTFITVHLMWSDQISSPSVWKRWKKLRQLRACYRGKRVITASQTIADDLMALGIKPASLTTIPDVYDFNRIRTLASTSIDVKDLHPYILHIGMFSANKRHDLLLDALLLLNRPDLNLVLIGEGEERHAIEEKVQKLGLSSRVHFLGWQDNPYAWIKHALLTVICSDTEGLSRVLVESLIVGTPIISTDAGGNRELLTGPLADYLIPRNNAPALAKMIERVIEHPYPIVPEMIKRFDGKQTVAWYLQQARRYGERRS
jgi:glycosyltransferase involved in cell wall biosynthesis